MHEFQARNFRRGQRIARCVPVVIHWRESRGIWRDIPATTRTLGFNGCLLDCAALIKVNDEVILEWAEKNRSTLARVVFRKLKAGIITQIALEFLDTLDFWKIDFGPLESAPINIQ